MLGLSNILHPQTEEAKFACQNNFKNLYNNKNSNYLVEILDESDIRKRNEGGEILETNYSDLRIGIVYCGRQSPGGNNIINGLLEFKKKNNKINITLIGFLFGTIGMFANEYIEITEENFGLYKNHGGYDFLGRSVDKIRTDE
jgi:hypothetical protein